MRTSCKLTVLVVAAVLLCTPVSQMVQATGGGNDDGDEGGSWQITKFGTKLPQTIYRASLAWTGEKAYLFTGRVQEGHVRTIYEFDPASGDIVERKAQISRGREMSTAAWLAPYAYIFGGMNSSGMLDEIVRYDPARDVAEVLPYHMPTPRMGASAVAVGDHIYIIGGRNLTEHMAEVLRFDPRTGGIDRMQDMPVNGGGRSALTDGERIYLFGGCGSCENETVFELESNSGRSRLLDTHTDIGYYWSTGVWTGGTALVFGGNDFAQTLDQFLEFTPDGKGGGTIEQIGRLPKPIELATSFFDERSGKAFLLGGRFTELPSDTIYVITHAGDQVPELHISAEGIAIVVGLMAFTVAVVVYQSISEKKGRGRREQTDLFKESEERER